jgi:hypothetical protein
MVTMHGNDNKTRERELGQLGLEEVPLVASYDLEHEELFRSLISHETGHGDGQDTDRNNCHFCVS